ncbi:MAG: putative glycosyl transferase [bacterium ADurb.BinA186]|jgi:glycosyltransferase involved in cell wall biosynthesis|nr:MAG: putative glycosyl transferase [bacterium ADurb.BinA186]
MKILVVSQQYWPENWRIVDICEELVSRGHQVTVVCGLPNDSQGNLLPLYRDKAHWKEIHEGVSIFRVADHPRKKGDLNLFIKYKSFARRADQLLKGFSNDFDIVLSNQLSPVMQAIPAINFGARIGKPVLMYCYDLWPESLGVRGVVDHGLTRPIYRHYLRLSRKIYNSVTRILVTSPDYINYLHETCLVPLKRMNYVPQYAEAIFGKKSQPKLEHSTLHNFVFAGNVGSAQDVETLLNAARYLLPHPEISIHILGSGSDLEKCRKMSKKENLSNVFFHGPLPLKEMPGAYEAADALLVVLSRLSFLNYVVPGKVQSYMEYGKPIIAACNGATPRMIEEARCGLSVPSGDVEGLSKALLTMATMDSKQRLEMGDLAHAYSCAHFSREKFFSVFEGELSSCALNPKN